MYLSRPRNPMDGLDSPGENWPQDHPQDRRWSFCIRIVRCLSLESTGVQGGIVPVYFLIPTFYITLIHILTNVSDKYQCIVTVHEIPWDGLDSPAENWPQDPQDRRLTKMRSRVCGRLGLSRFLSCCVCSSRLLFFLEFFFPVCVCCCLLQRVLPLHTQAHQRARRLFRHHGMSSNTLGFYYVFSVALPPRSTKFWHLYRRKGMVVSRRCMCSRRLWSRMVYDSMTLSGCFLASSTQYNIFKQLRTVTSCRRVLLVFLPSSSSLSLSYTYCPSLLWDFPAVSYYSCIIVKL